MSLFALFLIAFIVYFVYRRTKSILWAVGSAVIALWAVPVAIDQVTMLVNPKGALASSSTTGSTCNCNS